MIPSDQQPLIALNVHGPVSSLLILVERGFCELTDKALRRRMFHSAPDLIASVQEYIDSHNADPRPCGWTATAESILAKVARGRITLGKNCQL